MIDEGYERYGATAELASVIADMALLMGLIYSFHYKYAQPAVFYLKAPTLFYVFLFIALRALRRNKMRSTLTALGIIIGVASVVAMVAVGNGAQARIESQVAALGQNLLSVFAGIRPLLRSGTAARSSDLSREHSLRVEPSGLVTITGGKWTTYRKMAADAVDKAVEVAGLPKRKCQTEELKVHGYEPAADQFGHLSVHGADAPAILELQRSSPELAKTLHADLPYTGAEVVWATRHEMALTVSDVLARRTRALFLHAAAARAMAARVAELMAGELGRDAAWQRSQVSEFDELAPAYSLDH